MTPTTSAPNLDQVLGYEPLDGPIREWQVLLQNALVREYDRTTEVHKATGKWDSFYMKIIGEHIARFPLLHATRVSTAPTTGSAPNERDFEAYRRGVMEAFHVANICNVTRHDRTPEETCSYIVRSLARLANGGEEPIVPPASPAASAPEQWKDGDDTSSVQISRDGSTHKWGCKCGGCATTIDSPAASVLTDEQITEMAVEHLGIDYDRMPHGVLALVRAALLASSIGGDGL